MKHHNVTIKISTANAEFENHESSAVARILRLIANKLDSAEWTVTSLGDAPLYDINGNKVGTIRVTGGAA